MDQVDDIVKDINVVEHGTSPDLLCVEHNPIKPYGKLPDAFSKQYSKTVPSKVTLKDPLGNELTVSITIHGDNALFAEGWSHLADCYGVKNGGWVNLRYISFGKFVFEVTNLKGDKVTYPPRRSILPKNDYENPIILDGEDDFENHEPNPLIVDRSKLITAVKKKLTYSEMTGTTLAFSQNWSKHALPLMDGSISLVDEYGTLWPCYYTTNIGDGDTSGISRGWRTFTIKKKLFQGQTVVFGVMSPNSNLLYFSPSR